jgi:hypothetical protein
MHSQYPPTERKRRTAQDKATRLRGPRRWPAAPLQPAVRNGCCAMLRDRALVQAGDHRGIAIPDFTDYAFDLLRSMAPGENMSRRMSVRS